MKADGGKKAGSAHVNPTTGQKPTIRTREKLCEEQREELCEKLRGQKPVIRTREVQCERPRGRKPTICPRDQAPRPLPRKFPPQALKSGTKLKPEHEI